MGLTGTRNLEAWLTQRNYAPATVRLYLHYARRGALRPLPPTVELGP